MIEAASTNVNNQLLFLSQAGSPTYGFSFNLDDLSTGNLFLKERVAGVETNRVTFASGGNVGIGTTAPGSTLTVVGTLNVSGSGIGPGLYVDGSGNVGIGTTSPEDLFQIVSSGNSNLTYTSSGGTITIRGKAINQPAVLLYNDDGDLVDLRAFQRTNAGGNIFGQSRGGLQYLSFTPNVVAVIGTANAKNLHFATNDVVRMTINSTGNVGIGTTGPSHKLSIVGGQDAVIEMGHGSGAAYNWALSAQYITNNAFEITPSTVVGGHTFTTPVATFLSNGNVGIGTTAPASLLTIQGSFNATSSSTQFLVNSNGDVFVNLKG